ncbi:MAG: hypothetical protein IKF72_04555 [Kiritimatiellae bacterium]|nr:hypothetical protein [Kiritimatiellia bacterium]
MAKPVINYKGYMADNPADRTGPKICVPQIVDRNQVLTLEQIVADAIDRGLIAGLKSSAAKSIADGVMLQLGRTLNGGTGVIFGEFFAVRPYLTGTIENMLAPITSANKLRVRFVPGSEYKLDGAEFSFHNVTESESVPEITEVVPSGVGSASGTWSAEHDLNIIGRNLKLAENDVVALYNCTGETPVKVSDLMPAEFTSVTDVMLTLPQSYLEEHPTLPAKLGLKVVKKITVDGIEQTIESNMYVATKAA